MKGSGIYSTKDILPTTYCDVMASPVGDLCIGASDNGVKFLKVIKDIKPIIRPNQHTNTSLSQLEAYFNGQLREFDITFDISEYTDFAKRVWSQLSEIPYGTTISYMQLAIRLGDAKCIRAAGTANGRNPIPIIIPCHRVIGSDGSLTGFGLGLDVKLDLLKLENPKKYNLKQGLFTFSYH